MATEGTLELLSRQIAFALSPLEERLAPGKFVPFIEELGLAPPPAVVNASGVVTGAATIASAVAAMPALIAELDAAVAADDAARIAAAGGALLRKVVDAFIAIDALASGIRAAAASLPAADRAKVEAFAAALPRRLFDFVVLEYMRRANPAGLGVMSLLGLADDELTEANPADPLSRPARTLALHLDRFPTLLTAPAEHIENVFGWGAAGFDGRELLERIQVFIANYDLPVMLIEEPGQPPALEAFMLRMQANTAVSPPGMTIRLRFPAIEDFEREYELAGPWSLLMSAKARFEAGLDVELEPPLDVTFLPPSGNASIEILVGLAAQNATGPMTLLGDSGGSGLFLQRFSAQAGLKGSWSPGSNVRVEPAASAALEGGRLKLDFSQADGFLQTVAGGVQIDANFDTGLRWSPSEGVTFEGSSAIEIALPAHLSIGPLQIDTLYLIGGIDQDANLPLELSSAFSVNLGPLQASVDRFGLKVTLSFPADGKGNLGRGNLEFAIKPPNGIGLLIDAGVVKGGGYLYLDFEKEEYAGALELEFSGFLTLKAIGLLTTRLPDGSKGFSLLAIITAEFGTPIQLGFGFVLVGVGGLLGLNRTMNLEALLEGVRTGAIESVMFPDDVIANAPRIISDLRRFFPAQADIFLIGPMAKLGWGTPPLVTASLGIVIEIPGNIAILGVLKVALPHEDAALLVLQVNFVGGIEFDKARLFFFAAMFESRVLYITIEGEMGLLVAWGDDPDFVLTVGGFHPQFKPPPLPFPSPKRVALDILNQPWGRIRVMGYFAVTSNTVQLGARAELFFGFSEFKVEGHLGFDALFQFNPFFFIIELSCGVSLKVFGVGLFSISLKFSLEGPTPWRAKGYGKLKLLFFSIKVNFDFTWGESQNTTLPPIEVMALLVAELEKVENWQASLPTGSNLLVSLRSSELVEGLVLHPVGTLSISQRAVPLEITLDKVGSQKPSDANKFSIGVGGGLSKVAEVEEKFAIAQFQSLSDAEKLSKPAFQNEAGGVELAPADRTIASGKVVRRNVRYETVVIDGERLVLSLFAFVGRLFTLFLGGNATAKAAVSYKSKTQMQPFADKIAVADGQYAVALNSNNKAVSGAAIFTSEARAREYMNAEIRRDPSLADSLHVIPAFELNEAA